MNTLDCIQKIKRKKGVIDRSVIWLIIHHHILTLGVLLTTWQHNNDFCSSELVGVATCTTQTITTHLYCHPISYINHFTQSFLHRLSPIPVYASSWGHQLTWLTEALHFIDSFPLLSLSLGCVFCSSPVGSLLFQFYLSTLSHVSHRGKGFWSQLLLVLNHHRCFFFFR